MSRLRTSSLSFWSLMPACTSRTFVAVHFPRDGLKESWLSATPEFDAMPVPYRRVEVEVLRAILAAIRNERAIEIEYQSMNTRRPAPEWRWITPHALGHDGLRWHVRAYCHIDHKFKDFILSRCLQIRSENEPAAKPEADRFWREVFEVTLAPNPALSKAQQAVIAQDYEMADGRVSGARTQGASLLLPKTTASRHRRFRGSTARNAGDRRQPGGL